MDLALVVEPETKLLLSECDALLRMSRAFAAELAAWEDGVAKSLDVPSQPEIIRCDLRMPGMDGEVFRACIRRDASGLRGITPARARAPSLYAARLRALSGPFLDGSRAAFRRHPFTCELVGPLPSDG